MKNISTLPTLRRRSYIATVVYSCFLISSPWLMRLITTNSTVLCTSLRQFYNGPIAKELRCCSSTVSSTTERGFRPQPWQPLKITARTCKASPPTPSPQVRPHTTTLALFLLRKYSRGFIGMHVSLFCLFLVSQMYTRGCKKYNYI